MAAPTHLNHERRAQRGKLNALRRHDPERAAEFAREYNAARLGDHITEAVRNVDDVEAWAERVAASLPPLTADEAAAVGRLASALDARRSTGDSEAA